MILINGKQTDQISVLDRGLQYGDGVFETIEIRTGRPVFLKQHLERLASSCAKLKIPLPDLEQLLQESLFVAKNMPSSGVLKLIVTRGVGGRGYRQPEKIAATRVLSLHGFPDYPEHYQKTGISVRFCQQQLGLNPMLAGIKHLNRLEQVLARSEWVDDKIQEGLMLNYHQQVVEGTMSNLFLVKDQVLMTPIIDQCGISGIVRNEILAIAQANQIEVKETGLSRQDVFDADEIFVTNSIIGLWPVQRLEQQCYHIGSYTRRLESLLRQRQHQDLMNYD